MLWGMLWGWVQVRGGDVWQFGEDTKKIKI